MTNIITQMSLITQNQGTVTLFFSLSQLYQLFRTLNMEEGGEEHHLQCLDVFKLVSIPLFDLPVLPCCEEQMSFGNKLEEHDAVEDKENGRR